MDKTFEILNLMDMAFENDMRAKTVKLFLNKCLKTQHAKIF